MGFAGAIRGHAEADFSGRTRCIVKLRFSDCTFSRVTGLDASEQAEAEQLRRILRNYSQQASDFVNRVLAPYAHQWKLDYASFRPIEEKGRPARVHAPNDLLHFDSFPTRPTNGARILRVFTNLRSEE